MEEWLEDGQFNLAADHEQGDIMRLLDHGARVDALDVVGCGLYMLHNVTNDV